MDWLCWLGLDLKFAGRIRYFYKGVILSFRKKKSIKSGNTSYPIPATDTGKGCYTRTRPCVPILNVTRPETRACISAV